MNFNFDPFGRTVQSSFGFSFWSWQGNQVDFSQSKILFWILVAIVLAMTIAMWFWKAKFYQNQLVIKISHQMIGSFFIILTGFRIIVLGLGNYPNYWELIPLHFCRLMICLVGLTLVFKQTKFLKHLLIFTIIGAWFGIIFADFNNSNYWQAKGGIAIGYDTYVFWDFLIIHLGALLISSYLLNFYHFHFTKKDLLINTSTLTAFTIIIFFANWALTLVNDPKWNANWFYLAPNDYNSVYLTLKAIIGPLASWPLLLFVFIATGYFLTTLSYCLYFWMSAYYYQKGRIYYHQNNNWITFKTSKWF